MTAGRSPRVKLVPQPRAFATAMVAAQSVDAALTLLNRLQDITGGAVEAFEFMPRAYMDAYAALRPEAQAPFAEPHAVNILVELGATAPRDAAPGPTPAPRHRSPAGARGAPGPVRAG